MTGIETAQTGLHRSSRNQRYTDNDTGTATDSGSDLEIGAKFFGPCLHVGKAEPFAPRHLSTLIKSGTIIGYSEHEMGGLQRRVTLITVGRAWRIALLIAS